MQPPFPVSRISPSHRIVRGLAIAGSLMLASTQAAADEALWLDLLASQPGAMVEGHRRQRFEEHYDCLSGRGNARLCERLEDQARQGQMDVLRQSASPAPLTPPVDPDEFQRQDIPLPGRR
ncbi:MAG: hypothetical protein AABZ79_19070 [Pseudomonadota bacterium]|jgi:uncharacterized RmlC-like cupin family protein